MATLTAHRQLLIQQREKLRAELASAAKGDDPLAAYDNFVKWILQNYANHSESGLLELLEETVMKFRNDGRYKVGDLRHLKLWILFANHVDKPAEVYEYMLREGIGKFHALFFEEYSECLEREGRFAEAETIINLGLRTQANPLERLHRFHNDYISRRAAGESLPPKMTPFQNYTCSHAVNVIRAHPLQNIAPQRAGVTKPATTSYPDMSMTTMQATPYAEPVRPNPYAHMMTPAPPGKRPERLQFDLTLLPGPNRTEYSFEEAWARHLGLLGKRWPPPPPPPNPVEWYSEIGPSNEENTREGSVKVDFGDQRTKARNSRRQSPTVTLNTKEVLEAVYGMYNSPVREHEDVDGGEEKIMPQTVQLPQSHPFPDENAGLATRLRPFQPHVDQRRENATPGTLKFMPGTTKTPVSNAFTPNAPRKALAAKETTTPVPAFKVVRPEQTATTPNLSGLRSFAEEAGPEEIDVFGGDDVTKEQYTEEFTNPIPPAPPPRSFVPFVDERQDIPTTRRNEDTPAPVMSEIRSFQVHRDGNAQPSHRKPDLATQRRPEASLQRWLSEEHKEVDDGDAAEPPLKGVDNGHEERQPFVKSGRFADFNVMTPITERTFEFTTSTRAVDTPGSEQSSAFDKGFVALDAQDVAEKLAAELLADERKEQNAPQNPLLSPGLLNEPDIDENASSSEYSFFDRPQAAPFRVSDGFTIEPKDSNMLSSAVVANGSTTNDLTQVFAANSGLEPPNPCVPSDPALHSKIMSVFPSDPNHRELGHVVANHLGKLQRFAEKRSRRGSGASNSGRTSDGSEKLVLDLDGDEFEIFNKLGEGGFGAVFAARITQNNNEKLDEDDDEDDPDSGLFAIKVVRPTNRWESFVLRRLASAIPVDLRCSIVRPHTLYAYKDESYLTLDLCQQGSLLEIVNRATETGVAQPGGGIDELLVMFFTVELLRIIEGLHDCGFIHGDLKIDNCLIRLEDVPGGSSAWSGQYSPARTGGWAYKGIKLIDFGRTIDTRLFSAGQTFVADWKTDGRDCVEMREGRPWTFQADYSGVASIIYCMLFGKYIETMELTDTDGARRLKPAQPMKRYWQADFWNRLFDGLLNPCQLRPDGSLPVTKELVRLRTELEAWIQDNCNKGGKNLKGMLKKIEIATLGREPRK